MTSENLNQIGAAVHNLLPDTHGFVVIALPHGTPDGIAQYVSNCKREDAIKALKEILFRWGHNEEWMTKIK